GDLLRRRLRRYGPRDHLQHRSLLPGCPRRSQKPGLPGVYGSRNVCSRVSSEAFVSSAFVSGMSWGFSVNLGFPLPLNWAFNQIKACPVHSGDDGFDLDRVAHRPGADLGVNSVNRNTTPVDEFLEYLNQAYYLAVEYDSSRAPKLTLEWFRYPKYN